MKVLLSKECLSKYELKDIIRNVHHLFDEYNSKKLLVKFYKDDALSAHTNKEIYVNGRRSEEHTSELQSRYP